MRILALNPYHGGSHQQFLDQWISHSSHEFTLLTLPPRHFTWRIRQGAVGLAHQARTLTREGEQFDLVFTTSMLDAAELRGLLPKSLRDLPLVVYFHENQLVYPVRQENTRNSHFSLINWSSALACDAAWFNSDYNRTSLIDGLEQMLRKMPDEKSIYTLDDIRERASTQYLGIDIPKRAPKSIGALHIGWVGRWEHDKRADSFFQALHFLKEKRVAFRLTCLGQSFRAWPPAFDEAREAFKDEIVHMGYVQDVSLYRERLEGMDVVVSTADHEFFGIALMEAVGGGALPLVPDKLVYPELYPAECLYENTGNPADLAERLSQLAVFKQAESTLESMYDRLNLEMLAQTYDWRKRAPSLDAALAEVVPRE